VYCCADRITTYRGVSGVDCALLAWVLVTMAFQDGGAKGAGWLTALSLVAAKSAYEAATGRVLLPTSAPVGVAVVGVTHVVGLVVGAVAAGVARNLNADTRDRQIGDLAASRDETHVCACGRRPGAE
jgi:hypothetical protein